MQTNTNNNRKSIVTYCLITENTGEGVRMSKWCLTRTQYKKIRRTGKVIIKNIGRTNYLGLNLKNIAI